MATAGRAYVVRDQDADSGPGSVDKIYPYTLQGLTAALEDARFRSLAGPPQVVAVIAEGSSKIIRRYEKGHETPR